MRRLSFRAGLAGLVLAGLALRLVYALAVVGEPRPLTDPEYYELQAELLARGEGFIAPYEGALGGESIPTAVHPPLHTMFLAALDWIGLDGTASHRVVLCLVGAGTVALIGLLGRRAGGRRVGLVAAALAAAYPLLVIADGSLMAETLYGFLIASVLLVAWRLHDRPDPGTAAALGALVGLAALTRSESLLLAPVLLLPLALRAHGRRLPVGLTMAAALIVVLLPWTIRNAVEFDRFVPVSTNESLTIAGANCERTYSGRELGFWSPDCIPPAQRRNEAEQASLWRRQGLDYARGHSGRLPVVLAARVLATWDLYRPNRSVTRQVNSELRARSWQRAGTAMYFALLPLAVAGLVLMRRARRPLLILVAPAVVVTLSSLAGYGLERFRFAAEVPLVVLAAVALTAIAARAGQARGTSTS